MTNKNLKQDIFQLADSAQKELSRLQEAAENLDKKYPSSSLDSISLTICLATENFNTVTGWLAAKGAAFFSDGPASSLIDFSAHLQETEIYLSMETARISIVSAKNKARNLNRVNPELAGELWAAAGACDILFEKLYQWFAEQFEETKKKEPAK